MNEFVDVHTKQMNDFITKKIEVDGSTNEFLCRLFDFIIGFNMPVLDQKESVKFYSLIVSTLTNVIFPERAKLSKE